MTWIYVCVCASVLVGFWIFLRWLWADINGAEVRRLLRQVEDVEQGRHDFPDVDWSGPLDKIMEDADRLDVAGLVISHRHKVVASIHHRVRTVAIT